MTDEITEDEIEEYVSRIKNLQATQAEDLLWRILTDAKARDEAPTQGWLPIESAPKDKTLFLAATADGRIMIFSGMILDIAMGKRTPNHLQFPATHWQPLPASPEPTKE